MTNPDFSGRLQMLWKALGNSFHSLEDRNAGSFLGADHASSIIVTRNDSHPVRGRKERKRLEDGEAVDRVSMLISFDMMGSKAARERSERFIHRVPQATTGRIYRLL